MKALGMWVCGLGVVSLLLVSSGQVEARGGGFRGRSVGPGFGSCAYPVHSAPYSIL